MCTFSLIKNKLVVVEWWWQALFIKHIQICEYYYEVQIRLLIKPASQLTCMRLLGCIKPRLLHMKHMQYSPIVQQWKFSQLKLDLKIETEMLR